MTQSPGPVPGWRRGSFGKAFFLAISLFFISFSTRAAIPVFEDFNAGFNDTWGLSASGATAINTGWLRLTNATNDQQGGAVLLDPFPSSTQMVITFDYAMYGGTNPGADGFVFILQDGAQADVTSGDYGGCLGYCRRQATVTPGVKSAYVGVAFDEYGNMSDPGHVFTGGPGVSANHVLIKGQGAADGLSGYQYLVGGNPGVDLDNGSRAGAYRIRILIINNVITVQRLVAGVFTNILAPYNLSAGPFPQTLPATLRLGFTAGTGGSTNIHEIDNLTVDFPTDLVMDKTGSANVAAGGPISYTLTTTNNGPYDVNSAVITDTIPASITGVTWTCAASGGAVCVTGNGSGNALSETINIPMGGTITMTVNGTVNPATLIGTVISNTASVALPNGLADIVAGDNTDTLNTTVNGAAVSIVATTNGSEPGIPGQFTVSIAQPVTQAVTVNYTVTGTATAGTDYTTLTGSIVIPANTSSVTLNVPVLDDLALETTETVIVTLNSVTSAFTGTLVVAASPNNTATINLLDNEKVVSMAATDATGNISGDTGVVVVTILDSGGAPAVGIAVSLAVSGSATLSSYLGVTDANGQISVLVSDTLVEVVNVTAMYDSNGDNTPDLAVVTGSPAVVTFGAAPGGNVAIHAWHMEETNWASAGNNTLDYIGTWAGDPTDGPTMATTSPALVAVANQGTCGYGTFDGSDDNIELNQVVDINTDLTLTAWVRTVNTGGKRYVIARGESGTTTTRREIYLGLNGANFSAGSRFGNSATVITASATPLNTWVHIAATMTGGTWTLYVNGVSVGSTAGATWPVTSGVAEWSIGGRSDTNGDSNSQWNGNIDEVKMYDYALSAAQIAAVMGERHACPGPNLSVIKSVAVLDDTISAANDKAIPGATLRYTISLVNSSASTSSDSVVVTDNFDDSRVTYVPGSVSVPATVSDVGGVPAKSNRIVSSPLTVPAGGTVTVTFDVIVD